MNREELEEVFNRVYVGQYKKNEKRKVDGSKTLDRNYFSRFRRVSDFFFNETFWKHLVIINNGEFTYKFLTNFLMIDFYNYLSLSKFFFL